VRLYLSTSLLYFLITAGAPTIISPATQSDNRLDFGVLRIDVSGSRPSDRVSDNASRALPTKTGLTGAERDSDLAAQVVVIAWIVTYCLLSLRTVYGGSAVATVAKGPASGPSTP
jgi:hypothetical protein